MTYTAWHESFEDMKLARLTHALQDAVAWRFKGMRNMHEDVIHTRGSARRRQRQRTERLSVGKSTHLRAFRNDVSMEYGARKKS